jgi:hypothetical protein
MTFITSKELPPASMLQNTGNGADPPKKGDENKIYCIISPPVQL